jgi:demethylmenaquinone methyltransferase/2-methoxy-6-polyprenyl-1,4-benzoquinol methylase
MDNAEIYHPSYVKALFDEMTASYGAVNILSSLGFCHFWRRACVLNVSWKQGMVVHDWMTGMGELWPHILQRIGPKGHLIALDISTAMCERARAKHTERVEVIECDVFENNFPNASADCIVSTFGIKTFSDEQKARLAGEMLRVLKPGGAFSLIEISVPEQAVLRTPYMFYVKHCIPLIGRLMLGNPENYRMLGVYTERFKNCDVMSECLKSQGMDIRRLRHFGGCATSVFGRKPL